MEKCNLTTDFYLIYSSIEEGPDSWDQSLEETIVQISERGVQKEND